MSQVLIENPDHKCRYGCGAPMPLPEMWGKYCPRCGWRQPTLNELMERVIDPTGRDPSWRPLEVDHSREHTGGFVTIDPSFGLDEALKGDVFAAVDAAKRRREKLSGSD